MSCNKGDARDFARSMFELGYGAADEKLSRDEIRQQLKEAGVDPDAAWTRTAKLLEAARGKIRLEDARAARERAQVKDCEIQATSGAKSKLVQEIQALFALAGPGLKGMYARNWTETAEEDLLALRDQLKRTIEREAKRQNGNR